MDFLFNLPALFKVLAAFGLILFLNQVRVHLSLALFLGTIFLGIWTRVPVISILKVIVRESSDYPTLALVAVVTEILILAHLMKTSGQLSRIVESFRGVFRSQKAFSVSLPALIGLLPMPGGALFSAPMLEASLPDRGLSPERKTIINYWFRHIWEYWLPLYPGMLLSVRLLEVRVEAFILAQLPLSFLAVLAGWILLLGPIRGRIESPSGSPAQIGAFIRETTPIWIVILTLLASALIAPLVRAFSGDPFSFPQYSSVIFGLLISLAWVIRSNRIGSRAVLDSVLNPDIYLMAILIFGIMAFRGILIESQAISGIQGELTRFHIPPLAVILFLPFLSGLVTGITIGFVGASFPVVISLAHGLGGSLFAWGILAFGFGYAGMMLSPIHLCFALTKDHFHSRWGGNYRYLIPLVLIALSGSALISLILFKVSH